MKSLFKCIGAALIVETLCVALFKVFPCGACGGSPIGLLILFLHSPGYNAAKAFFQFDDNTTSQIVCAIILTTLGWALIFYLVSSIIHKQDRPKNRGLFLVIAVFLLLILVFPLMSELWSHGAKDVSGVQPYNQFRGKDVIVKKIGSIWKSESSFESGLRSTYVHLGARDDEPPKSSGCKRLADFNIGTRFHIESIKRRKEPRYRKLDETIVLCTVFLDDGRRIECQMDWHTLDPDPLIWTTPNFDLMDK